MSKTGIDWIGTPNTVTIGGVVYQGSSYTATVHGVDVRIDEMNGHVGFGYRIGPTTYGDGGRSLKTTQRMIPDHIRRNLERRDQARTANAKRARDLGTISSNEGT